MSQETDCQICIDRYFSDVFWVMGNDYPLES